MRYVSTRGRAPALGFEDAMLSGLARDGGLYAPESWPQFSEAEIAGLAGLPYAAAARRVIAPFIGDAIAPAELDDILSAAYGGFRHAAVCPLVQTAPNQFLLELHHGPTLAFKDVALQLLARLMARALEARDERVTIVGATSGDTGSAAIEAFRGLERARVFILYPDGRVSDVQRRQMTTVGDGNVAALAVAGDFDACQAHVKAMFNDHAFRDAMSLAGVNSINWARIMAQIVYYFTAAVALGAPHREVSFTVPTGNFGDIFAGWCARRMGLPIARLVIATNENDILARMLKTGRYERRGVAATMSPSMDIQVSSNFERLLHQLLDGDGGAVERLMSGLGQSGAFTLAPETHGRLRAEFDAVAVSEEATLAEMARMAKASGLVIDPHTAVGTAAARTVERDPSTPMATLATAHAAKFPDAVARATGARPALPPHMADLMTREERLTRLPDDLDAIKAHIAAA